MTSVSEQTMDEVEHLDEGFGPRGLLRLQRKLVLLLAAAPLLRLALRWRRLDQLEGAEALHQFLNFNLRPRRHGVRGGR